MIVDGETGYTVPVDDVEALTDRLVRLLSNRALARSLGQAGRERAERRFTWTSVVGRIMDVVRPVVGAAASA
jgi:glycosyltransferase involved in cell wall biosynthesis